MVKFMVMVTVRFMVMVRVKVMVMVRVKVIDLGFSLKVSCHAGLGGG